MANMRAVQVSSAGGPFEIVEREVPSPGFGAVRIKVEACGICHSDAYVKEGTFPGISFPRIPGHEVVGTIDAIGQGVVGWAEGQRVGVGWNGGHCGRCDMCRSGEHFACQTETRITGLTCDGGYAEYMVATVESLARVPADLTSVEAAPLMCAGITTFNAIRNSGAKPGEIVAILGLGGLGHLGVQFASRMGFRTVAIARGANKEALAKQMGAWKYIDSEATDPAAELNKLGGASVIIATVTNGDAMTATIAGLRPNGSLMVLGAPPKLEVSPGLLIGGRRSVKGWYSGTAIDSQDTMDFSVNTGVRSMNEQFPMEKVNEAYERMLSGKARFRVVLTM